MQILREKRFLLLPVIGIVFMTLVVCLCLSVIPGTAGVFLILPKYLIKGLNLIVSGIANLRSATLLLSANFVTMLLGMIAIAFMSQYNLFKHKRVYACLLAVAFVVFAILDTLI